MEIQEIQEKSLESQNAHCSSSTCPGGTVSSDPDLVMGMVVLAMVSMVMGGVLMVWMVLVMVAPHLPGLPLGTPLLLSPPLEGFCRGPARPPT